MATWVAVIAETKGRADFWEAASKFGVRAVRPLRPYVLIDCGAQLDRVRDFGHDLSRALEIETVAFIADTDEHHLWAFRAGKPVEEPRSADVFDVCKRYGVEDGIADAEWTPPRRGLFAWLFRSARR